MSRNSKWLPIAAGIAAAVVFGWLFPPFHIHPLTRGTTRSQNKPADVNVEQIATAFWNDRLATGAVAPVDLKLLLDRLNRDPSAAAQTYGRRPGIGGPSCSVGTSTPWAVASVQLG